MEKTFYVEYNSKFVAMFKTIKSCLNFISRKGYVNDDCNSVSILDSDGNIYNAVTGEFDNYD